MKKIEKHMKKMSLNIQKFAQAAFDVEVFNQLKRGFLQLKGRDFLTIAVGLGSGLLAYRTIKIYLHTRRYKHMPGPSFDGYLSNYTCD
jgi:hypothetical protein